MNRWMVSCWLSAAASVTRSTLFCATVGQRMMGRVSCAPFYRQFSTV